MRLVLGLFTNGGELFLSSKPASLDDVINNSDFFRLVVIELSRQTGLVSCFGLGRSMIHNINIILSNDLLQVNINTSTTSSLALIQRSQQINILLHIA